MIKADGNNWIDEYKNTWSKSKYSQAKAQVASHSLKHCEGCHDCANCSYCVDCTRCIDCSHCDRCRDCMACNHCCGCETCTHCRDCRRTKDSGYCTNCTGCVHCDRCSGCIGCGCCKDCHQCTGCHECADCRSCGDCAKCKGSWHCTDCTDCRNCVRCRRCTDCITCRASDNCNLCSGLYMGSLVAKMRNPIGRYIHKAIGSRKCCPAIYWNNKRIICVTGCFTGTLTELQKKVERVYGGKEHREAGWYKEYMEFIKFAKAHVKESRAGINAKRGAAWN